MRAGAVPQPLRAIDLLPHMFSELTVLHAAAALSGRFEQREGENGYRLRVIGFREEGKKGVRCWVLGFGGEEGFLAFGVRGEETG